jgi:hypothetical protein
MSIVDNNLTNPDTGGAGWITFWRQLTVNTTLYVNGSTGSDNNNGLTPATPKKTIQAAVNTAWTFPPNNAFSITIDVADGTYAESVATPSTPGPSVIIIGNVATPSNVVATFTTSNTISGAVAGWVFLANGGGTMQPGSHTFSGNIGYAFASYANGNLSLVPSSTFTLSAAMTCIDFAIGTQNGTITVPATGVPTFTGAGSITAGARFLASLNGTINTQGAGSNYFPGASAGTTNSGGQYA